MEQEDCGPRSMFKLGTSYPDFGTRRKGGREGGRDGGRKEGREEEYRSHFSIRKCIYGFLKYRNTIY